MKKRNNTTWFLDWYKYCQAYLRIARIGIKELSEQKYKNEFSLFNQKDIYRDKIILIPIIWSLKHAVELLLKAVSIRIANNFSLTHDTLALQNETEKDLNSIKIIDDKGIQKELLEINRKYINLNFWNGQLIPENINRVEDKNNIIFRYPENDTGFTLDLDKLRKANGKEIRELQDDLEELEKILLRLHSRVTDAKIKGTDLQMDPDTNS